MPLKTEGLPCGAYSTNWKMFGFTFSLPAFLFFPSSFPFFLRFPSFFPPFLFLSPFLFFLPPFPLFSSLPFPFFLPVSPLFLPPFPLFSSPLPLFSHSFLFCFSPFLWQIAGVVSPYSIPAHFSSAPCCLSWSVALLKEVKPPQLVCLECPCVCPKAAFALCLAGWHQRWSLQWTRGSMTGRWMFGPWGSHASS